MQPTRVKPSNNLSLLQGPEITPLAYLLETWAGMRNELVPMSDKSLDAHMLTCSNM